MCKFVTGFLTKKCKLFSGRYIMQHNGNDANKIHEATHGYQLYKGELFKSAEPEIKAYKRQFFFTDGEYNSNGEPLDFNKSVPSIKVVNQSNDIDREWLWGIQIKDDKGNPLYTPSSNP